MMNPGIVLGYHGCSQKTADLILHGATKHLRPSKSQYEWLGNGVYFWENSYDRALKWACMRNPASPAVIGAILRPGTCLDLADSGWLAALNKVNSLFEHCIDKGIIAAPRENKGRSHQYDCALINYFLAYWEETYKQKFDTIRASFAEGNKIGKSSFGTMDHIQWVVRNPQESIVGYFRPGEQEENDMACSITSN